MKTTKPGVIKSIIESLCQASEKQPITRPGILQHLVARFPDREPRKIKATIATQVPSRLRQNGYEVRDDGHGGFWLLADGKLKANGDRGPSPRLLAAPQAIRIDAEVFAALQKHASPFVETPNDVLRKLLGLPPRS